jgi:NSS family neurotransmitter:Na+ symporter
MTKRGAWKTRYGFYLAAIGSACGLGNLWRFPYVVGDSGGGAFVLMYVLLSLLVGLPLLVGELMLGKASQKSILMALSDYSNKFKWVGRFSVALSLIVLSYYALVSGWVLHFMMQFLIHLPGEKFQTQPMFALLLKQGWLQMGLASVHLLLAVVVVIKGVQDGLERWIGSVMPVFTILLILLIFKSLALPSSVEALRFLFYPDFSKLNWSSMGHALGHVFFTLSVGFGTMVTFGSYMRANEHVPTAGYRVALVDTLISLFAGLLVFPIALQASNIPLTDPGLLFEALPRFLSQLSGGILFGFAFFLCLYLAALGASIGLLEVIVSNIVDRARIPRGVATWMAGGLALLMGMVPALWDHRLLEVVDSILINWFLPISALGMSMVITFALKNKDKLFIDPNKIESVILYPHWLFTVKYIVPFVIILALLLQLVDVVLLFR